MWRLIVFIVIALFLVFFIGFNLQNICNISIIFHTFENVHVVMPILISFVLGILVMLPFVIAARSNSRGKTEKVARKIGKNKKSDLKNEQSKESSPKVERVHSENETEYVPNQHLDEK